MKTTKNRLVRLIRVWIFRTIIPLVKDGIWMMFKMGNQKKWELF
jgi:hypothetical protein